MLDGRRIGPALELVLGRGRVGEDASHDGDLLGSPEMGRAEEDDLLVVEVGPRAHHGQRLDRLRRRAQERDEPRIAGRQLDPPVADGHRVDDVTGLDHPVASRLDDDRLHDRSA